MSGAASSLREALGLVVISDPRARGGLEHAVASALSGGATTIQLRSKTSTTRELLELGHALRAMTRTHGALLIVNDRVDVALAVGADGAHLGEDDLPLEVARRIAPSDFILGRSVDTAAEALAAADAGADYVGLGPVFPTETKTDTGPVLGLDGVRRVRAEVPLPLVVIGGITPATAADVVSAGADGIAVLGAVMLADDPGGIARELVERVKRKSNGPE